MRIQDVYVCEVCGNDITLGKRKYGLSIGDIIQIECPNCDSEQTIVIEPDDFVEDFS